MKPFGKTGALLAALLLAALPAASATYQIDPSHSDVGFQIRHLVGKVRGSFPQFEGSVHFDPADLAASSVTFEIDAASIDTANADRDEHLRGEDFFDVEKFPEITFVSKSFKKTGENRFDVGGTLTMHGVAKEIVLPVTFNGEVQDPWGNTRAGFSTSTTLNRKDYGISWNAALDQGGVVLGDEVSVDINLEAIKAKPEAKKGGEGEG